MSDNSRLSLDEINLDQLVNLSVLKTNKSPE